jgi:hypothetical protein
MTVIYVGLKIGTARVVGTPCARADRQRAVESQTSPRRFRHAIFQP